MGRRRGGTSYAPSGGFLLLGVGAAVWFVLGLGILMGWWEPGRSWRLGSGDLAIIALPLGFVGMITVLLGWRRFTLLEDGLEVQSIRGRRFLPWDVLGWPRKQLVHRDDDAGQDMPSLFFDGQRGMTHPTVVTNLICDARGRVLYRIGPWYKGRYKLMRQIREALLDLDGE